MKFSSLLKKGYRLIEKKRLSKNSIHDNFYIIGEKPQGKKVVLYLKNPEFMHFGDHFFFEPLLRFLENNGYIAFVMPTKSMEFYFKKGGQKIGTEEDLESSDFVITRFELLDEIKNKSKSIIAIDTASLKIKEFLCKDIVNKTAAILNKKIIDFDYKPLRINVEFSGVELEDNKKYIIFNNYIDSGGYRMTPLHKKKLLDFAEKFAKENNCIIIHTGTIKEKEKDKKKYSDKWIDLRGITKPEDLFWIFEQKNIIANISFDAFSMHVAFIYGKKNYIKFRGRFTKKGTNFIIKYVNPPFPVENSSDYITYI